MSQLDDIWNDMQILMEEVDTDDRNDFKQAVKALMLELIGDMEQRETDDMSLKSWTPDDYKAFGRNELRNDLRAKVSDL